LLASFPKKSFASRCQRCIKVGGGVSGTTVVDDRTGTGTGTGSDEQLQQLRRQRYSAATQDGGDGHNGERISPHCHPGRRAGARIQVFFLTLFYLVILVCIPL
jgi:hypothetical protein